MSKIEKLGLFVSSILALSCGLTGIYYALGVYDD